MTQVLRGAGAVVTGAGHGICRALATRLAAEGARVVVNDLDAAPAEETMAAIRAAGGEAAACNGDVTTEGFAERFVGGAVDTWGGLDMVVNNAGYTWDNVIQPAVSGQSRRRRPPISRAATISSRPSATSP